MDENTIRQLAEIENFIQILNNIPGFRLLARLDNLDELTSSMQLMFGGVQIQVELGWAEDRFMTAQEMLDGFIQTLKIKIAIDDHLNHNSEHQVYKLF